MDILQSFVSMFLTCYLIYWIVSLFRSSKGPLISFILVTVDAVANLALPIYNLIYLATYIDQYKEQYGEISTEGVGAYYFLFVGQILSILIAYLLFIYLFYLRNMNFTNQRMKEFERQATGKSHVLINIVRVFSIILTLALYAGAIYMLIVTKMDRVRIGAIFMLIIALVMTIVIIRSFVKVRHVTEKNVKIEKVSNFYLYIETQYQNYLFESKDNSTLKEALNGFDDTYIVNERGVIKGEGFKNLVYMVKVSDIPDSDICLLQMSQIKNDKLIEVIQSINPIHKEEITLDKEFNIVSRKQK